MFLPLVPSNLLKNCVQIIVSFPIISPIFIKALRIPYESTLEVWMYNAEFVILPIEEYIISDLFDIQFNLK